MMRVTVKTAGNLGKHLPPGTARNRAELRLQPGTTVVALLQRLALPGDRSYLVSVNSDLIAPDERAAHVLAEGDVVMVMPPVKGG